MGLVLVHIQPANLLPQEELSCWKQPSVCVGYCIGPKCSLGEDWLAQTKTILNNSTGRIIMHPFLNPVL